ncbi:MAG: DUF4330 domain-containing protein [Heliobacteriaceae bacterium]|nr:DUF4330 domain-containing protein [Heliobacteriaceae bacterium]MDD4588750.1 DUF4330 domain-containing protein [Heliobacteriaceae bacterium]
MRLVDEKGRLFGLINPLDLIILVAVIALVIGLATKTKTIVQTTAVEIQFEVLSKRVHPEYAANLNPTDPLLGPAGFLDDAKIVAFRTVPSRTSQANAEGQLVPAEDPHYLDVHTLIKGTSRSATADFKIGGQEIKTGREYWLKTQFIQLLGTVENVQVLPSSS